jgi:HK97 family phage major capsid protein
MSDPKRTVELIFAEMQALQAEDDFDVAKYEELEAERLAVIARGEVRKRHEAYTSVAPAVIHATPKGDAAEDYAFAQYLRTGTPNSDLRFAQTEGSASGGGYAVPDGSLARLVQARTQFGGFINLAENITTASGEDLHFPSVPTAALYSSADIAAEGAATAAGADIVFGEVIIGAYRYTAAGTGNVGLKLSLELMQDAIFDIVGFVTGRLGERIARRQAYDVCNGSGSGEPQGIAYGTSGTIEHDPDGFAAFSNLVHALDPVYRPSASWVFNDTTAAALEQLLDGASGTSGRPMLQTSTLGIDAGPGGPTRYTLLGYPVHIVQEMPTWAADNVIGAGFGDWTEAYICRHVRDVQIIANPYLATGYVAYDAWARFDGKVKNAAAYVTGEGT